MVTVGEHLRAYANGLADWNKRWGLDAMEGKSGVKSAGGSGEMDRGLENMSGWRGK